MTPLPSRTSILVAAARAFASREPDETLRNPSCSFPIKRAKLKNIKPILMEHVDPSTHLVTDELSVCYQMKDHFETHSEINHKSKKCVRMDGDFKVTTNTIESFFAIPKRSNCDIHHHMSRKYFGSYCAERDFVYIAHAARSATTSAHRRLLSALRASG